MKKQKFKIQSGGACRRFVLRFFELVFAYAAEGAGEIFGDILPLGAGSDAVVGIARRFVVFVAANAANVLCHVCSPFLY